MSMLSYRLNLFSERKIPICKINITSEIYLVFCTDSVYHVSLLTRPDFGCDHFK